MISCGLAWVAVRQHIAKKDRQWLDGQTLQNEADFVNGANHNPGNGANVGGEKTLPPELVDAPTVTSSMERLDKETLAVFFLKDRQSLDSQMVNNIPSIEKNPRDGFQYDANDSIDLTPRYPPFLKFEADWIQK
jgi:hypothetical protein